MSLYVVVGVALVVADGVAVADGLTVGYLLGVALRAAGTYSSPPCSLRVAVGRGAVVVGAGGLG
jgi:hypothetical protein